MADDPNCEGLPIPPVDAEDWCFCTQGELTAKTLRDFVSLPSTGAIASFEGTTRDHFGGRRVLRLSYEGYVRMAIQEMKKVCDQIRERWEVKRIAIGHRLGDVGITETSVMIYVSSVHRREALEAAAYAIDEIKARVPIWKLEVYAENDGDADDDDTVKDGGDGRDNSQWKVNSEFDAAALVASSRRGAHVQSIARGSRRDDENPR